MKARTAMLLALGAALCACGNGGGAEAPPPITPNEEQAVADAAEMLGERLPQEDRTGSDTSAQDSID